MFHSRGRRARCVPFAAIAAGLLICCYAATAHDGAVSPPIADPPAASTAAELVQVHLRLSMPAGLDAREASVWVLAKAKPILAVFNTDGETVVDLPREEADARVLYVAVARPWKVIDQSERDPVERQDDLLRQLMIRFEQYSCYFPVEVMKRMESVPTRKCIASIDIQGDGPVRRAEVQMLRGVDMHGQVDHAGEHPRWYPLRWSMPGMSYAPRIGESGDFRHCVPEGVEISFLAWCEGCRMVDVTLPPWRRGDRGVHIRLPTTPAEELVDGPSLGFMDARVDRRTGEFQRRLDWPASYCRSLTFVSLDGKTMYHWGWSAIRKMDDVGAEFLPGGWKASDYFGQLGFFPDQSILHRLQLGVGTWWVFEMEASIGSGVADFWTCLEGVRDGFDIDGFGVPRVTVTREPGPGRTFDAIQIRNSVHAAAEWIRACRAADAEAKPRPAKPEAAPTPAADAANLDGPPAKAQ